MNKSSRLSTRVLIVEDSDVDQDLYKTFLRDDEERSYVFESVGSGREGLEACRGFEYDCVLLDYQLPDVDGLEVLERLARGGPPRSPVLVITGRGDERVAIAAMKLGATDYIIKSDLTARRLISTVNEVIEEHRMNRQARENADEAHRAMMVKMSAVGELSRGDDRLNRMLNRTQISIAELRGTNLIFGWMNEAMRAVIGRGTLATPHLNLEHAFGEDLMRTARAFFAGAADRDGLRCDVVLERGGVKRRFATYLDRHEDAGGEVDGLILTLIEEFGEVERVTSRDL